MAVGRWLRMARGDTWAAQWYGECRKYFPLPALLREAAHFRCVTNPLHRVCFSCFFKKRDEMGRRSQGKGLACHGFACRGRPFNREVRVCAGKRGCSVRSGFNGFNVVSSIVKTWPDFRCGRPTPDQTLWRPAGRNTTALLPARFWYCSGGSSWERKQNPGKNKGRVGALQDAIQDFLQDLSPYPWTIILLHVVPWSASNYLDMACDKGEPKGAPPPSCLCTPFPRSSCPL